MSQNGKHERKGEENPHRRQKSTWFCWNNGSQSPNSFWEAAGVQEPAFFSTHNPTELYFHSWKVWNLFSASFHMLPCFPSRDKSNTEVQYKTMHPTLWRRINSLLTSMERAFSWPIKVIFAWVVIFDTSGHGCAVNWIQGSATQYRWYLSIIIVAKSRSVF